MSWLLDALIWLLTPVAAFAMSILDPDVTQAVRIMRLCVAAFVVGAIVAVIVAL